MHWDGVSASVSNVAEYICILYSRLADYHIYMIRELKGLTADNHYSSDKCNLVLLIYDLDSTQGIDLFNRT